MKIVEFLLQLLRSLFGGKPATPKEIEEPKPRAPSEVDTQPDPEPEPEPDPEPSEEPEDEFDDPNYNVKVVTPDDILEREPPSEEDAPEQDVLDEVEAALPSMDSWKERQQALKDLGYYKGAIDGIPGRQTGAAIRGFEEDNNLKTDGKWDTELHREVAKALLRKGEKSLPPPPVPSLPFLSYKDYLDPKEYELDQAFFDSFVDLTSKSNVKDSKGRRRRKGRRVFSKIVRLCWHQTSFTWRAYLISKALRKYTGHHKTNAHVLFDTDGTILLIHNFFYYLWTANAFNPDCISIEVMGNFEGELGTGNWYKPDKFGRARPTREQIIRGRQFTIWLMDPEQGPADEDLPKPLLEWRLWCRKNGNPLKWNNTHRESTDGRPLDCGSELWYHIVEWSFGFFKNKRLHHGPLAGKGEKIPEEWKARPPVPPLEAASKEAA